MRLAASQFAANTETRAFGHCVSKVIDICLKESQNNLYLSAYYLHPKYREDSGMLTAGRSSVYRRSLADRMQKKKVATI